MPKLRNTTFALHEHIRDALYTQRIANFHVLFPNQMIGKGQRRQDPSDGDTTNTAALWGQNPVPPSGGHF